jgi:hypothetical protein
MSAHVPGLGIGHGQRDYWLELPGRGCVAVGSKEAVEAAARLFGYPDVGKLCVTPNGRVDGHGKYVRGIDGVITCMFCGDPL